MVRIMKILIFLSAVVFLTIAAVQYDCLLTLSSSDPAICEPYKPHFVPLFPDGEKLDSALTARYNDNNFPIIEER